MQSISDTVSTNVPAITFKLLLATCTWRFFSCLDFGLLLKIFKYSQ